MNANYEPMNHQSDSETAPPDVFPDFAISLDEAGQRLRMLLEFVRDHMTEGEDYGVIPGTSGKPTLFKPGAEKLNAIFGLAPIVEITNRVEDWDKGFVAYEVKVTLLNKRTSNVEAEGVGNCNSRERKYKNQDAANVANTILKMAKKRCLGSTTPVLVRTSKGVLRTNLSKMHDLFEAAQKAGEPLYVPGVNGDWRLVEGMIRDADREVFRIEMGDGSYLRATAEHRFPTSAGLKYVSELETGDVLLRSPIALGEGKHEGANPEFGWLAGLFIADGHYQGVNGVGFTLNQDEKDFSERIAAIATLLGATFHVQPGEGQVLRVDVFGPAIRGLIEQFVDGDKSDNKHLSKYCWRQGKNFLRHVLQGYLAGDACYQERTGRNPYWMVGFTGRNVELENDLRALSGVLGFRFCLKEGTSTCNGKTFETKIGWIKPDVKTYNQKDLNAVVSIRHETNPAVVYDIQVDGDHLFCLANGLQTHNSLIDATLSATRASGLFTQDLEDLDLDGGTGHSRPASNNAPQQSREYSPRPQQSQNASGGAPQASAGSGGGFSAGAPGGAALTDAQRSAILAIASKVFGRSVKEEMAKLTDKPISQLSKSEASAIIDKLRSLLPEQPAPREGEAEYARNGAAAR